MAPLRASLCLHVGNGSLLPRYCYPPPVHRTSPATNSTFCLTSTTVSLQFVSFHHHRLSTIFVSSPSSSLSTSYVSFLPHPLLIHCVYPMKTIFSFRSLTLLSVCPPPIAVASTLPLLICYSSSNVPKSPSSSPKIHFLHHFRPFHSPSRSISSNSHSLPSTPLQKLPKAISCITYINIPFTYTSASP